MKKLDDFTFGVLLTLGLVICFMCFRYAQMNREMQGAIGGEVFVFALPLMITKWKMWTTEQEKKKEKLKSHQLKKKLQELTNLL